MRQDVVSWNSQPVAVSPKVAVSAILGKDSVYLKLFTVVPDGKVWRWRVSFPNVPGKCANTSRVAYATRSEAERAVHAIASIERPSITMLGAWDETPKGYVGSEYAEDHVGV